MERIYFDYASTTPVDPQAIKALEPYFFERFGNASSPHQFGREAQKALEDARAYLSQVIGAHPDEIILTSGATESNNQAIITTARRLKGRGNHIILSGIEHHSVLEPAEFLREEGFSISYAPVDGEGLVSPQAVEDLMTDQTVLIAVMHASNEIGTIQPISAISAIARERGICFLVDAVQTVGHLPVHVNELGADMLSLSAHKFYGPKGIGALYVRKGTPVAQLLRGGDQEKSRRASTQNVSGAVGLAKALELCQSEMPAEIKRLSALRDRLLQEVPKLIDGVKINGHPVNRLPNNAHFAIEGVQSEALLMSLDMNGIAASMGSACTAGSMEPSHVLKAIGLSDVMANGALRLTIGRWTTEAHIEYLLEQLPQAVLQARI